jgi:ring-1,2-phenylacetyl-CoA epoxidase subunit PaaA
MGVVVPFCNEVGINVPAHYDEEQGKYVIDVPFPMHFDAANRRWEIEKGQITWEEVMKRWKTRGPMNEEYVAEMQRGARMFGRNGPR